jgi:hypothetical protein
VQNFNKEFRIGGCDLLKSFTVLHAAAYAMLKEIPEHAPWECANYKT